MPLTNKKLREEPTSKIKPRKFRFASSVAGIFNSSVNRAAREENARRPAVDIPSSSSSSSFSFPYPPSGEFLLPSSPDMPRQSALGAASPPPPLGLPRLSRSATASSNHDLETARVCSMMTCREARSDFTGMLEWCDGERLHILASLVTSDSTIFLRLAKNQQGSSRLRMLLGRSRHVDHMIFTAVADHFFVLMTHRYGRYVATLILHFLDRPRKHVLYQLTESHALALARDHIGCASLNDVITAVDGHYRDRILKLVASNTHRLSPDPCGTYVIRHALGLRAPQYTREIATRLFGHYARLSRLRFGSRVVERVLESQCWELVLDELLETPVEELLTLALNASGNRVLRKALNVSHAYHPGLYRRLVSILRPRFEILRSRGSGRIIMLIENLDGNA